MRFSIDEDMGSGLSGWFMPDNPATAPRVVVQLSADQHMVIDANILRPLLKEWGLHNTGVCGFHLDESNCPGLTNAAELEIRDADENFLIYRRRVGAELIDARFFRLEPQLFRALPLDQYFERRFQMSYCGLQRHAEETIQSIFSLGFCRSLYASGQIFWRFWEPLLRDNGYRVGVLLRDPYEEFAERVLLLKLASGHRGADISDIIDPSVQAAAGALHEVDLQNIAELERIITSASLDLRRILYNPLTYLLAAKNPFDSPQTPPVAVALESLADFDAVGLREETTPFFDVVSAALDLPTNLASLTLPSSNTVAEWATFLRGRASVQGMIEMDIEVYKRAANILQTQGG
jgi:hypothetical protein